jgi:hypothetical protein
VAHNYRSSREWCWHQLSSGEGPVGCIIAWQLAMVGACTEASDHISVKEAEKRLGGARLS